MTALPNLRMLGNPREVIVGENFLAIYERLRAYGSTLSGIASVSGETVVNDSGTSLAAGTVVGFSGGAMAAAVATAAGVRALCVVPETTANGASFSPGLSGAYFVRTDGLGGFTQGGAVWLSAATAGTGTATRPTGTGKPQLLGRATTATVEADGTLKVLLNLTGSRTSLV